MVHNRWIFLLTPPHYLWHFLNNTHFLPSKKKIFVLPSVSLIEFELIDGECVCCTILLALFGEFCEWAEVVDEPHSIMSFSLFYKWERNCGSSQKLLTAAKVGVIRNVSDT